MNKNSKTTVSYTFSLDELRDLLFDELARRGEKIDKNKFRLYMEPNTSYRIGYVQLNAIFEDKDDPNTK